MAGTDPLTARLIREAREKAGKSQTEAAAAVGLSRQSYIATEQGKRTPAPAEFAALAALFDVGVRDLGAPDHETTELLKQALIESVKTASALRRLIEDYRAFLGELRPNKPAAALRRARKDKDHGEGTTVVGGDGEGREPGSPGDGPDVPGSGEVGGGGDLEGGQAEQA